MSLKELGVELQTYHSIMGLTSQHGLVECKAAAAAAAAAAADAELQSECTDVYTCGELTPSIILKRDRRHTPATAYRQIYPGLSVPSFDHPPLSDLSPMPGQSQGGNFETLAMHLGLPIAPSRRVQMQPVAASSSKDAGSTHTGTHSQVDTRHAPSTKPSLGGYGPYVRQDKKTGLLFPTETRNKGLDELAQHMEHQLNFKPPFESSSTQSGSRQVSGGTASTHPLYSDYRGSGATYPPQGVRYGPYGGMQYDPSPGFYNPQAHYIMEQQQPTYAFTPPAAQKHMINAPRHRHSSVSQADDPLTDPHNSSRHTPQNRRGSGRRISSGRLKRLDQGPEASPADIYPEDAIPPAGNWNENQNRRMSSAGLRPQIPQLPMQLKFDLQLREEEAWPTPAEALKTDKPTAAPVPATQLTYASAPLGYAQSHQVPTTVPRRYRVPTAVSQSYQVPTTVPQNYQVPTTVPQNYQVPTTVPQNYQVPTTVPQHYHASVAEEVEPETQPADIHPNVPATASPTKSSEHSRASSSTAFINSVFQSAASDALIPDQRPLTPRQIDGSRYGITLGGIAIMDNWAPERTLGEDKVEVRIGDSWPEEQFRTRPRNHEGWGGLKWGHAQGWVKE
ncbi:hypothetical protein P280DRAFT_546704 [Massarina eburnea CBS 473.64]|uniref:Uncharacterized protein n=1 Tax=Massarina eburnea CBS 473.64 TaxID=1395130 RepID=A0A6A6S9D8_9PLEO|nr:hypothetical protein P280DRAFT_546704 [Massarina eburnea CBS 473.64]